MARRLMLAATLCAVFILGLITRIDSLGVSLWLDEFGTFWVVDESFTTMLRRCWEFQGQSPFYYSLAWFSLHSFGESEIALRVPSLLLTGLTVGALYLCARMLSGPKAGFYAASLAWVSGDFVQYSVAARPYMLVLFTAAVAIAGFVWAVKSGSRRARVLWVVGGASVAWAHYVHYPLIVGLFVAYALLPPLRLQYRVREFVTDAALQLALVGLCAPQIFALFNRRGTLSWIDTPNYGVFIGLLLPLVAGFVVGLTQPPPRGDAGRTEAALAMALLICLLFQLAIIESASFVGINLLRSRYLVSIVVPALLFVAGTLARASTEKVVVVVTVFAIMTAMSLQVTKKQLGTFSGMGFENWRGAVSDLSGRIRSEPEPLVFFRSGFVEEDIVPLGNPPPVSRAPLRSPGAKPFAAAVIPLSFRWGHPLRERYFQERIVPAISSASHFFVLGPKDDYMEGVDEWVASKWPHRFAVARADYGLVELLEFSASSPDP